MAFAIILFFNPIRCMDIIEDLREEEKSIRQWIEDQNSIIDDSLYLRINDLYNRMNAQNPAEGRRLLINSLAVLKKREAIARSNNLPSPYKSLSVKYKIIPWLEENVQSYFSMSAKPAQQAIKDYPSKKFKRQGYQYFTYYH